MRVEKRSLVKKVLSVEILNFNLDDRGMLSKSENWVTQLKNKVMHQAKKDGCVIKKEQIEVVWNDTFMEYIMYIDGHFCGYIDISSIKHV